MGRWEQWPARLLTLALCLAAAASAREVQAGAFVFAGEANGVTIVTHPPTYNGSGGTVTVDVCIDPTSANAASMEISVRNAVVTFNRLEPVTGNVVVGGASELASNEVDFESTVLHELGHCIGLAHTNLGNESGVTGDDTEYTRSTDGTGSSYGLNAGSDGVRGSSDDQRGNDLSLFYFQIADNDPFSMEASVFDSTTYSRLTADLPTGHTFAANGERDVATLLGVSGATEAVMQQGAFFDEEQRGLTHDDVATLRFAMSGVDEIQGTGDDYALELQYVGLSASCDIVLDFDAARTSFASCQTDGVFIGSPHAAINNADIFFDPGYNWFFSSVLQHCGNGELDDGEQCDDGGVLAGDCCSPSCAFESPGSACEDGDACTEFEVCDGVGLCGAGSALDCDDGLWCNGVESCDSQQGCEAGVPVSVDDGVACTDDSCDEVLDIVVHLPNPVGCADGQWCNGAEVCDGLLGCLPGSPVVVDDGVTCTDDSCDEVLDVVVHVPNPASCGDGQWCNGIEICDGLLGCLPGVPVVVDDGVACTDDSCDEVIDVVLNAPNDAQCDDALWCNGAESCDVELDCQPGTPVLFDDGVGCTDDSCDEELDVVVNAANHLFCDDGDWCNGPETCDLLLDCQPGNIVAQDACWAVPATTDWAEALLAAGLLVAGASLATGRLRRPAG